MLKTIACAVMLLLTTLIFAQGPGMGMRRMGAPNGQPPDPQAMAQMQVNMLAAQLSLTDSQKATALTIFTNSQKDSQTIQSALRTAQESLSAAVKKNDAATIDSLAFTIGTATGQLTAVQSKAQAAFYAILTADQQALYDKMPPGGPGGGRGGRGPMGPPPGAGGPVQ
jgi:Spy/CpxP family protein refolding chaperone